ncbi:MAG TPA: histidine kinase dimerization/phosphoacceptor domain -containing protein [Alphaproteobacteria bacterium]|nr:histidine kinase dimerization/phosphoacceptor domain -containing protein [Alphaproteobacteria bacterium]
MAMQADHKDAADDPERLAALRGYEILDTPREPAFDQLVELAARICGTPISVINLIEDRRQWFKAETGLGIRETPLDISICRHFLLQPGLTVVNDTLADSRLCANPLVSADDGLRFYAGCLLQTADGQGLGTLCVLDRRPRDLDEDQRFALRTLADQVMAQLDLRLALRQKARLLEQKQMLLEEVNHRVKNNLQLVSSIVGLQLRSVTDPAAQSALADTSTRLRSIAVVHERLFEADGADAVDLSGLLQRLMVGLQATARDGVVLTLEAGAVAASPDLAVPVSLIVNELVTNALKYAYPAGQGGAVRLTVAPEDGGRVRIAVRDHGQGLPPDFDIRRSQSLGMRIVLSLAGQIGADLSIGNADPGTLATLVLSTGAKNPTDSGRQGAA